MSKVRLHGGTAPWYDKQYQFSMSKVRRKEEV